MILCEVVNSALSDCISFNFSCFILSLSNTGLSFGFFLIFMAYIIIKAHPTAVVINQIIVRYSTPEYSGTSAID